MSDDQDDPTTQGDAKEHPKGGLDPAPVTPTEEKSDPETGTGSADKRSPDSQAEQDDPAGPGNKPGTAGGHSTR